METEHVFVVPYDPQWPAAFAAIRRELENALGPLALSIEHVGSTAVENLAAKPIIDIDVVIRDNTVLAAAIRALASIGYRHEGDLGIEGREAFRYEGKPHLQTHHLYVCPRHSAELKRHLAFRDHLRAHPDAARQYGEIKQQAAALYPEDIERYLAHKAPFIKAVYADAMKSQVLTIPKER